MWTRFSLLAWLCYVVAASSYLLSACGEWVPKARPVQPERVLEGATRVETLLDPNGRYALVTRFGEDDARSLSIVDWKNHNACQLPENVQRFERALFGPKNQRASRPFFWLPLITQDDEGTQQLQFADERCNVQETYGKHASSLGRPTLEDDGREVLLFSDGSGNLSRADPWLEETMLLASEVRSVASVLQLADSPPALWLIEDGKLTQRLLDGTLVTSLGEQVSDFSQAIHDGLRVAYVDGSDLYEAVGPEFEPVPIADDACEPEYRSGFLDLYRPCADRQLVRILLFNGKVEEFDEGVYRSFDLSGYTFEYLRDDKDVVHLFAEPPGRAREEIIPPIQDPPLVIDSTHVAGIIRVQDDAGVESNTFAIWDAANPDAGLQKPFDHVIDLVPFIDVRTSSFLWLMHQHTRTDEQGNVIVSDSFASLSMFKERTLRQELIDDRVPLRNPGVRGAVRGYSFEVLPAFPEPLLLYIKDPQPLARDPKAFRGLLRARLLSGELASDIDADVSSYVVVATPLPGILYGVEEGEHSGLWFAAL